MPRPPLLLVVEDDADDARLIEIALERTGVPCLIEIASSGEAALDRLHRRGAYAGMPRPDVVLVDVQLPGVSGYDVLDEIRATPELRNLRVAIQTSRTAKGTAARARRHGTDRSFTKPLSSEDLAGLLALGDETDAAETHP